MKWITREKVKVDRVACPWLIRKFIDPQAEFLFVPADQVTERAASEPATPFDDPALRLLAQIVHGADVTPDLYGRPEAAGLKAIAEGLRLLGLRDDHEILARESVVYDALYAYCQGQVQGKPK